MAADPPAFLALAGHPVRWRLLHELARSDRQVRELCERTREPQSLVSYHLGRLRREHVVSARKSSADRRDTYYRLDLERCGTLLARTGEALHPGLRLAPPPAGALDGGGRRPAVLFLCTGNSARSQMAQAFAERLGAGAVEAASAGSDPKPLHAGAVEAMRAHGIDIAGRRSTHVDEVAGRRFDHVVTLCDRVREVCPPFPDGPDRIHWSLADPAREPDADGPEHRAYRRTAEEVATRVAFLLHLIVPTTPTPEATHHA